MTGLRNAGQEPAVAVSPWACDGIILVILGEPYVKARRISWLHLGALLSCRFASKCSAPRIALSGQLSAVSCQ